MDTGFPRLSQSLKDGGVLPIVYTTSWFLTVLTYNCPFPIVAHFWDLVMCKFLLFEPSLEVAELVEDFVIQYISSKHKSWKDMHPGFYFVFFCGVM